MLRAEVEAQSLADPERLPWPADWFGPTDAVDAYRCRLLWGAVFAAKVEGALRARLEHQVGRRLRSLTWAEQHGRIGADWIGSGEFLALCGLLDRDGASIAARLQRETETAAGTQALLEAIRDRRYHAAAAAGGAARWEDRHAG